MKNISLVALISLFFVACNKDGDIFIDDPSDNITQPLPDDESPMSLGYSGVDYTPAPGQFIK
ncbi:MAG: hypothetical protein J1E78_03665, partial [Muribaculaceae bacterium]|nr:hypothetical protein [Muribaculaceae bacterium]